MTTTQSETADVAQDEASATVKAFLYALQDQDLERALAMLTEDVEWINLSLPTVRGRANVEKIFKAMLKVNGGFRVHFDTVMSEGDVVLTQRIDAITLGPFQHRFWVAGRFELRDGQIAVWRDGFDWADMLVGFVRALAGLISPRLNRPWPAE
jgi:limonene-1,2-epoxide hydrolase